MTDTNIAQALAALSARVIALEGAIAAFAPCAEDDRTRARLERFAQEAIDRFAGLPVDDAFIDLLRQSFDDMLNLVGSSAETEVLATTSWRRPTISPPQVHPGSLP